MLSAVSPLLRRVGFPVALICALGLGVAVRWPLINAGFFADDFDHHAMQVGTYPLARGRFDMFNFGNGTAAENRVLMQSGHFPWWSDPHVHLSMLRPLSSALIALDFAAFGLDARYFHVHSFVWWALCVVAAGLVLIELLPQPVAALALFFFALEECHSLPLGWLANRSTLISTALGFFALRDHIVFRTRALRSARLRSLLFAALSLMAGEYAFAVFAYFAAFEFFRSEDAWRRRALSLLPFALLALAYLVVRQALGYGVEGSGFYISPTGTPLAFLVAVAWRVPVMVADLTIGVVADWYTGGTPWRTALLRLQLFSPAQWRTLPEWHAVHISIGLATLALVIGFYRALPKLAPAERLRALRWLLVGAVLSLVPVSGSMPSARLMVAASLGFDALFAALLWATLRRLYLPGWLGRVLAAVGCGVLLYLHGYQAAERSSLDALGQRYRGVVDAAWVLSADIDDATISKQDVVIVAAQDLATQWYIPYILDMRGRPMPHAAYLLSGAAQAFDLVRVADDAIELRVITSGVDMMAVGSNYRPADRPFHVGDEVRLSGFTARVLATLRGQPQRVRFWFPASLDDPHYVFLYPTERGLRRLTIPPVGTFQRLPRPIYPNEESLDLLRQDRLAANGGISPVPSAARSQ